MILLSVLRILIYACSVVICVRVIIKRTSFSSASYSVRAINDSSVGIYKYCILSKYGIIIDVPINICDLVLLFPFVCVSRKSFFFFFFCVFTLPKERFSWLRSNPEKLPTLKETSKTLTSDGLFEKTANRKVINKIARKR